VYRFLIARRPSHSLLAEDGSASLRRVLFGEALWPPELLRVLRQVEERAVETGHGPVGERPAGAGGRQFPGGRHGGRYRVLGVLGQQPRRTPLPHPCGEAVAML